eukprot:GHVT01087822.1.p3 GENE.GHVT01087822.1~~GHVT01087822.1.p3  ORF type:complete len:128 (+),score=20.34 GHVT01087822.1:1990-2373(+)
MRRRLVFGFRQVVKAVQMRPVALVIIAPNIQPSVSEGGMGDVVKKTIQECQQREVPVVFALSKNKIGNALGTIRQSVVAVVNQEGARELVGSILQQTQQLRTSAPHTLGVEAAVTPENGGAENSADG